jgi:hypothetical protein
MFQSTLLFSFCRLLLESDLIYVPLGFCDLIQTQFQTEGKETFCCVGSGPNVVSEWIEIMACNVPNRLVWTSGVSLLTLFLD